MSAFDELMKEATGGAKGSANGDSGAFESLMKDAQKLPERPDSFFEKVRDYRDKLAGVAKGGADVAVGLVANAATSPLPGLAGIADNQRITEQMQTDPVGAIKSGNMFSPTTPIERAQTVRQVQDAVTVAPFTEQGQQYADYLSEKLAPVAEGLENAQNQMGEVWREDTGSDRVGAVASAIPGAIVEAVPLLGGAKVAGKMSKVRRAPVEREISKELADAAPSGDMLKTESTRHFTDIDEMGVTVDRDAFGDLVTRAEAAMKSKGGSQRVTTEAWGALEEMKSTLNKLNEGQPVPLSELEELREIASVAADSPAQPKRQAVALAIVDEIDDFIEGATPSQFNLPKGVNPNEVGVKYRQAREQWGRYRRSQMLDKAVIKAGDQASGFENGLRIQFRQILNSEKKSKYFKPEELVAMRRVVNGTSGANLFKTLGKAGVDFGGGNNALLAMITGLSAYGLSGNPVLAFSVVGASSVSKKLAERLTASNAALANQVVRVGPDARKIVEVYMRNTPKAKRSADELSLLLLNKEIDLSPLKRYKMEAEAAALATKRRFQLAGALTAGDAITEDD